VSVVREASLSIRTDADRLWALVTDVPRIGEWMRTTLAALQVAAEASPQDDARDEVQDV
jgi:hypothetical protein